MGLKDNIDKVLDNIKETAEKHGRDADEIKLVAVTKYSDTNEILEAYNNGLDIFGENRVQPALPKIEKLPNDIEWHMIGHLQRNKVKYVLGKFEMIHSVDSLRLAKEIQKRAAKMDLTQKILLEVNVSGEESKFGLNPKTAAELTGQILEMPNIHLLGFMTMAPFIGDEKVIANVFKILRLMRDNIETEYAHKFPELSIGMTNDYKIAIAEGATILRIGSAIFKGDES
ncbi:MAG: YggS family pyridoxal phosphate-dependent enzyme [Candidatus Zixiibacteriota bacterium]